MTYDSFKKQRRSIRLKEYDYASTGAYFVTLCVREWANVLASIEDEKVILSDFGRIARNCWLNIEERGTSVSLDEFVIMPNHMHGIILIDNDDLGRGGSRTAPTEIPKPLGRLIGAFKTTSTKQINITRGAAGVPIWQRNYYEKIIRNDKMLSAIRAYIRANPSNWDQDPENPQYAK